MQRCWYQPQVASKEASGTAAAQTGREAEAEEEDEGAAVEAATTDGAAAAPNPAPPARVCFAEGCRNTPPRLLCCGG